MHISLPKSVFVVFVSKVLKIIGQLRYKMALGGLPVILYRDCLMHKEKISWNMDLLYSVSDFQYLS